MKEINIHYKYKVFKPGPLLSFQGPGIAGVGIFTGGGAAGPPVIPDPIPIPYIYPPLITLPINILLIERCGLHLDQIGCKLKATLLQVHLLSHYYICTVGKKC